MVKKTYSEKLKDPRWQKKRLKIFRRDKWTCCWCGDKNSTLHVHHSQYSGEPWEADDYCLNTICEKCHQIEHALVGYPEKFRSIAMLQHGVMYNHLILPSLKKMSKNQLIELASKILINWRINKRDELHKILCK